jgi:chorismate-pyruvate lyase
VIENASELFNVSGYLAEELSIDWLALPPIVRVLLSTDGTVTKALESFFWEPVAVIRKVQTERLVDKNSIMALGADLPLDELLWQRTVELVGQHSERRFVRASSLIRVSLLPPSLKDGLAQDDLGIGGVIRELGLETYRKVIAIGQLPNSPGVSAPAPSAVWRHYRLYYKDQVLMHIREEFYLAALR